MGKVCVLCVLVWMLTFLVTGCGETVNGMVKDTKRIGTGIKTVFVRGE